MIDYHPKVLSEAYIHLEPNKLYSAEQLEQLKRYIEEFARVRADFFLSPDVSVEVHLEFGSIKARITAIGSIALLIQAISNYPDFREGLSLIRDDSHRFANAIISEIQFHTGAKHKDVMTVRTSSGVIGSINHLTHRLERVCRDATQQRKSFYYLAKQIEIIHKSAERIISDLETPLETEWVKNGLASIFKELPEAPEAPENNNIPLRDLLLYRDRRDQLKSYLEA